MPVIPTFEPGAAPGMRQAAAAADNSGPSWIERAQARHQDQEAEQRQVLFQIQRPLLEAKTAADIEKFKVDYDGILRTQETRKQAYKLYQDAQNDFDYLNLIPDDKARAQASREWLSRYSQLANVAELKDEMAVKNHLATSNIMDAMKLNVLGGNEVRSFEYMTQGMSPEDKEAARQVKLGLKGRQSGAAIQYKEVTGPDGTKRLVAVDPRSVGAQVVGSGESFGSGVSDTPESLARKEGRIPDGKTTLEGISTKDEETAKESAKLTEQRKMDLVARKPKRQAALQQAELLTERLGTDIDELIGKVTSATAGPGGVVLDKFPGTAARDLAANLDSIKANIGFQTLQAMRESSPTGGALGQVSDMENKLLQSVLGNIQIGQSPAQLINNLRKVKQRVQENFGINRAAYSTEFGDLPESVPTAANWDESKEKRLQELKAKLGK